MAEAGTLGMAEAGRAEAAEKEKPDRTAALGGVACTLVNLVVLFVTLVSINNMRSKWEGIVTKGRVYTVRMERFWGPVHAIIPSNCTQWNEMDAIVANNSRLLRGAVTDGAMSVAQEHMEAIAGQDTVSGQEGPDSQLELQDFMGKFSVNKCNASIEMDAPTGTQKFWAMKWLSTFLTGSDTVAELHASRQRLFFSMSFVAISLLFLNLAMDVSKITGIHKEEYKQIDQEINRPKFLLETLSKACESSPTPLRYVVAVLQRGLEKLQGFMQQATICSLFLTYWSDDHFVMLYVPGVAFAFMYFSLAITLAYTVTTACHCDNPVSNFVQGVLPCWACLALPLNICFMGYFCYEFQFLIATNIGKVMEDDIIFKVEFMEASDVAKSMFKTLFGINIAEIAFLSALEIFL